MASILKQLGVKGKNALTSEGSSHPELSSDSGPTEKLEADGHQSCFDTLAAQPQSPSPEAEYDKLLVRGKISAPPACSSYLRLCISVVSCFILKIHKEVSCISDEMHEKLSP